MKTSIPSPFAPELDIAPGDISRLFIEFAEEAGLSDASRIDIIRAFRSTIRYGISSMLQATRTVSFEHAVQASLQARKYRRPSTRADLKSFTQRMLRDRSIATRPLREITVEECKALLDKTFAHSAHSYRKAKMILHSIFHYGQNQGWCTHNPTKAIVAPPVVEERIEILSTRQINNLVRACETAEFRCMAPAIYLMLWCGIRPGEVRRLRWCDIDPREKMVYVEGKHSKTGGARAVPLRGEAAKLCELKKESSDLIAPSNWNRLWKRVRRYAGLCHWQPDVLRHTFASLHLKYFHNLPQLQEEMGHRDCSLLRTRYLNLRHVSHISATKFFHRQASAAPCGMPH